MCPLPLVSEGRGPHLGAQQASWARVGRANALPSSPAPLAWEGPSSLPLLVSLTSLLCPQGPTQPGGGFGEQGIGLGAQHAPCARVCWAIALRLSSAPPGGPLLPASPGLPSLPPVPPGPRRPGWGFGVGVPAWELSRLPGPSGPGDRPLLLSRSSQRVPPACLSWSPWPQGRQSCLASTSPPPSDPYILPIYFGVPPVSLGIRVLHQWPAGALTVGRR